MFETQTIITYFLFHSLPGNGIKPCPGDFVVWLVSWVPPLLGVILKVGFNDYAKEIVACKS